MNTGIRRRLDTAIRVRDFSEAYPEESAGYATVLGRLQSNILRAEALATQQRSGTIAVRASASRRRVLRGVLHQHLLRPLARVAASAATEEPELEKKFALPRSNANHQTFRTAARAMAAEAQAQKDRFMRHGMTEPMLNDLLQGLDQYDEAIDQANTGRRDHIGARAELVAVMRDTMQLVLLLDGLNLYRFRDDAEKLAAWEGAKHVPGSAGTPEPAAAAPIPAPAPVAAT